MKKQLFCSLVLGCLLGARPAGAQEGAAQTAQPAFDLQAMDCGELNNEAGLLPLRKSHVAGEDLDLLCKVTVAVPETAKGALKAHSVNFTVSQAKKTSFQQSREVRLLSPGKRTILFVVPAEKLPTDGGKVTLRAELSKPASQPSSREVSFELNTED